MSGTMKAFVVVLILLVCKVQARGKLGNLSIPCWSKCGGGRCALCGENGYCCRRGWKDCPSFLADVVPAGRGHKCVRAIHGFNHSENGHGTWDYAENGPSTWGGVCKGSSQSPINIVTCETEKSSFFNRVFSHNYWKNAGGSYKIKNNGHALQIDLPKDTPYQLKKGQKSYTPLQIHIHFDGETGKGSEHTLNSKQYFAELHIVHRNSKYTTTEQIMGNKDGLLVIGIFVDLVKGLRFEASDLDFSINNLASQVKTPNDRTSFAMQLFGFGAKYLIEPKSEMTIDAFPLAWLLPTVPRGKKGPDYVNYRGSLTTPPCSEIVDWVVITGRTLEINEKVANNFKVVKNSVGTPMSGNFRPIQNLNGRDVYSVKGMI